MEIQLGFTIIFSLALFLGHKQADGGGGPSPPAWGGSSEITSVSEDATTGTAVTVTTQVLNSPDSIEILDTSTGTGATTLFSASATGSNINLVTTGPLDRETTAQFILVLNAKNAAGNTSTELNNGDLELTINVDDVNDNDPVFSPTSKCKEMAAGTAGPISVETLAATDADTTANGLGATAYTFEAAQTNYDIDAATGAVTVKSGQTLSTGTEIFGIVATDQGAGPRAGTGSVTVCIGMTCCSTGCCSGAAEIKGAAVVLLSTMILSFY